MKIKILLLSLFTLIITNAYSQSQLSWFWQNPKPQGNVILKTMIISNDIVYAISGKGIFMKSFNGGEDWQLYSPRLGGYQFRDFWFVNASIGYIVCDSGKIIKTIDGGLNWLDQSSGTNKHLYSIQFLSPLRGYISGYNNTLLKTVNGGETWTQLSVNTSGNTYFWDVLHFIDEERGYVAGSNDTLFKTTNGGVTWTKHFIANNFWARSLHFINANTGFTGGLYYNFYRTTNAGESWHAISSQGGYRISSIDFLNDNTGFASTAANIIGSGSVLKSTNSGLNWSVIFNDQFTNFENVKIKDGICYATGNSGKVIRSSNLGQNWSDLTTSPLTPYRTRYFPELKTVHFINENTGYAAGERSTIIKSTNGGAEWFTLNSDTSAYGSQFITCIQFINENTGFASGEFGFLEKTTDAGQTWSKIPLETTNHVYKVQFLNDTVGYLANKNVMKTTNGGGNWFISFNSYSVASIHFSNALTGYCTEFGVIYKTTDGGVTWASQTPPITNADFKQIRFYDENNGVAVGTYGMAYKTTNGGANWTNLGFDYLYRFRDVFMVDPNIIYITGYTGNFIGGGAVMLRTINGGMTWEPQVTYCSNPLNSVFFVTPLAGYSVGFDGAILKTITGGNHPVITNISSGSNSSLSNGYELLQNYPNPFNPVTKIKYSILTTGLVTLKVYDILGREVAVLVNEKLMPGNYTVEFNGSKLMTGIYFYKLKSGNFSKTKKMVLIK